MKARHRERLQQAESRPILVQLEAGRLASWGSCFTSCAGQRRKATSVAGGGRQRQAGGNTCDGRQEEPAGYRVCPHASLPTAFRLRGDQRSHGGHPRVKQNGSCPPFRFASYCKTAT